MAAITLTPVDISTAPVVVNPTLYNWTPAASTIVSNQPVVLQAPSNPYGGNGTVDIYITYQIILL